MLDREHADGRHQSAHRTRTLQSRSRKWYSPLNVRINAATLLSLWSGYYVNPLDVEIDYKTDVTCGTSGLDVGEEAQMRRGTRVKSAAQREEFADEWQEEVDEGGLFGERDCDWMMH